MNQKLLFRLLLSFIVLSCLLFILPISTSKTDNFWLIAIGFLIVLSAYISGIKVVKDFSLSQARFNASFFGMMFFKMILAFILIILYLKFSGFTNKFGVIFIVCSYFIYTCFEIQFILHKLRTNSEKIQNADNARK